ncbi:hypothetical protein D1007_42540 [Hordeum vulgare]|nr:hypothetical protein D1007_42540 [Hordeum vulgare]
MQVIDSEERVEEIIDQYADKKLLTITAIKATEPNLGDMNMGYSVEEQLPIGAVGQSNMTSIDEAQVKEKVPEYYGPSDDEGFVDFNWCEYKPEYHDTTIEEEEEEEIIKKLRYMRKQRENSMIHFQGDTKVEEEQMHCANHIP